MLTEWSSGYHLDAQWEYTTQQNDDLSSRSGGSTVNEEKTRSSAKPAITAAVHFVSAIIIIMYLRPDR